jgi:hypothetical protein
MTIMRTIYLILPIVTLAVACAHYVETSSSSAAIARWEGRDVSKLIGTLGPFDTTSIKGEPSSYDWSWGHSTTSIPGESRLYNWFRFGNCRLTAHTNLEGTILKLEMEGTGQGCDVYVQKIGGA